MDFCHFLKKIISKAELKRASPVSPTCVQRPRDVADALGLPLLTQVVALPSVLQCHL